MNAEEARALASDPLSFLHVSRAEIDLPPDTNPYADAVYAQAVQAQAALRASSLEVEARPAVYLYRLTMGGHVQTGVAAAFSVDEYRRDLVKKHEKTRPDKENDRTRHIIETRAQSGPVLLTYRRHAARRRRRRRRPRGGAALRVHRRRRHRHTRSGGPSRPWARRSCRRSATCRRSTSPTGTIAPPARRAPTSSAEERGVRRGSSASRSPTPACRSCRITGSIKDLNGRTPEAFLAERAARACRCARAGPTVARKGECAMYLGGRWHAGSHLDGGAGDRRSGGRRSTSSGCTTCVLAPVLGHRRRAHRQADRLRRRHPRRRPS